MTRKTILITGIQGFVGSNLAIKELAAGNHVVGIVRDINHNFHIGERCRIENAVCRSS